MAGSYRPFAMGLHSRYVSGWFLHPSPLADRRGFVQAIEEQGRKAGKVVLFAFADATLIPLVEDSDVLERHGICVLPKDRNDFDIAFDKARTLGLAQRLGLAIPKTYFGIAERDFPSILPGLAYPVVLKPRRSVNWIGNSGSQGSAVFAFSAAEVERHWTALVSRTGEAPLLQEYIRGEEIGVEFLCESGRVLAASAHRRLRTLPPSGGAAAVKETIPLSYRSIGNLAIRLVSALNWSGPVMVEFKASGEGGPPRLMEINGRFWGSLPLAIAAGTDFPHLYYRLASGEHFCPSLDYRKGVVSRHYVDDLKHLLWVLFKRDRMRSIAFPKRLETLKGFLMGKACAYDVFDPGDLKPPAMEILDMVAPRRRC